MYYLGMKILSSSPYAKFNSKEWNSLGSKSEKFVHTPIKVQKKYLRAFTFKNIEKNKVALGKYELPKQMQLVFA